MPPRLFLRFFEWYCHPKLRDGIEGDLIELYNERRRNFGKGKADRKFMFDVLLLFRPGIIKSVHVNININAIAMYRSFLRVAFRNFFRQRAHNILNIVGLSMGIAAGLAVAIHIQEELSYEKSFHDYNNIYRVHRDGWATGTPALAGEFHDFFPDVQVIGRFAPYGTRVMNTVHNNPGEATGFYADTSVFDVFGFKVREGNPRNLAALHTAVITGKTSKRYFGQSSPIGEIIKFDNGEEFTVVAVMEDLPPNTHLQFDYLLSMPTFYENAGRNVDQRRGWMIMYTYARLTAGTIDDIRARMPDFIRKYYAGDPDAEQKVETGAFRLIPLKDIHLYSNMEKELSPNSSVVYVYVFIAVAILILTIASANFMSMFTSQALRRIKEVGMRKVIGAGSGHVLAQFLTEVSLLIFVAAGIGVILYQVALPFYNDLTGRELGPMDIFRLDNVFIVGAMLLGVILISGLYPAVFIARFKSGSFLRDIKLPNSIPNVVRSGLLVFQFVVSVSLIAATLIVRQQMALMKNKDLGFDKEQVLSVKLYGALRDLATTESNAFKGEFLKNPDILAVGRVDRMIGERLSVETLVPKVMLNDRDDIPDARVVRADAGFLEAMNIKIVEGRNFSEEVGNTPSYILNETAVRAFRLADPVDELLVAGPNGMEYESAGKIVGVVKDYHFASMHAEIEPLVIEFSPRSTDELVIRVRAGKTREALEFIRKTTEKLAPNSLFVYQFLDDRVDAIYRSEDRMAKVFQFFSALAIAIACMGLFGLSSYTIESKTKEIAIRKVLGATVGTIVTLVSSGIFRLIFIGFFVAVPLTWYGMSMWLEKFAYKIAIDGWVFVFTGLMVVLIAGIAMGLRTFRAAGANPVNALRSS